MTEAEANLNTDCRKLIMSEIMTPDKVNFNGTVHGGYVLAMLDRVAYACASRYAARTIVTLSVDQVFFKEPIYVGELLICYASVNFVGTTSLEVGIRVVSENLMTRDARHTNTCYFTMVALGDDGKPCKIQPVAVTNATEQRRYDEAVQRRETRLRLLASFKGK